MTDDIREAAKQTLTERAFGGGGLTAKDCEYALYSVHKVVLVRVREDSERHQVWLHVRGGEYSDVMRAVTELEEYKPVTVHFQVDHKRAREHHRVIADTPWIDHSTIG